MKSVEAKEESERSAQEQATCDARTVVLIYAFVAALWILLSDSAVAWLFSDPALITVVSTIKGWVFVAVTSLLLYGLIWRLLNRIHSVAQREREGEAEKERTRQLLNAIADSSTDAIFAKDIEGRYLLFNREAARLVGKTPRQVIGSDDAALFPPAQAELIRTNDCWAIAEQKVSTYVETLRTVDGERTYQSIRGPLRGGDGVVIGVFGISRDITERKLAEDALRAREHEFSAFFHSDAYGAGMISLDGRFLRVNESFCNMTGYSVRELLRMGPTALNHPDDVAQQAAALSAYLRGQGGLTYKFERRYIRKDGQVIWVQVNAALVRDASGKALYAAGTLHDITARKLHEDRLATAIIEVECANNAKSRFLAAASHDLRQPLSALSLYVNMLKNKVAPADHGLVENMQDCIGSLSELLTDLLDLSKLEAGVVQPNISDFSIAAILASLESIHSPEAQIKGLQLRCIPCPLMVRTDPVLFKRLLGNLIENAIRYTERGGVLVACRRRQGKTWFEVWDTGMGIPADKTTEIFEEFRQLDDGARNRGSGLGLAIVAKTAALLALEIRVRSRPGRGSLFAIELPLGQQQLSDTPALAVSDDVRRPLRIALVEDNALLRQALVGALQGAGHQVVAAATGRKLLAELGNLPPDIVVSDYRLASSETGFDVISGVRASVEADLPAILITGDTDPKLMRSMANRGIVVMHKPVDLETLQAYLEDLTCPTM